METNDLLYIDVHLLQEELDNPEIKAKQEGNSKNERSDHVSEGGGNLRPRNSSAPRWSEILDDEEIRVKKFKCKLCKNHFSTKETLRKHILSKHIRLKPFICEVCQKKFSFEKALLAHKEIHEEIAKYVCICGKSYKVHTSYMDHIKRVHQAVPETVIECDICSKIFHEKKTFNKHFNSVHKEKTIKCSFRSCDKSFSTKNLLAAHLRCHSQDQFPCVECGKILKTESYLQKHKLIHLEVRPFKCLECACTYLTVSHLNQHRKRVHSEKRTFQCSICGKCFNDKEHLSSHETSHSGVKNFSCDLCNYKTYYRGNLQKHKKVHSSNKKLKKKSGVVSSLTNPSSSTSELANRKEPEVVTRSCSQSPTSLGPWEGLRDSSFLLGSPDWRAGDWEQSNNSLPFESQTKSLNLTPSTTHLAHFDESSNETFNFASPFNF